MYRNSRAKPKATVGKSISNQLKGDLISLFMDYGEITLIQLPILYKIKYDTLLSSVHGCEDGLFVLLEQMKDILDSHKSKTGLTIYHLQKHLLTSKSEIVVNNAKKEVKKECEEPTKLNQTKPICYDYAPLKCKHLFDPAKQQIWTNFVHLLDKYPIEISKSPYDIVSKVSPDKFHEEIVRIGDFLRSQPNGVPLNQLGNYIYINKKLFGVSSIEEAVKSYTEVFYIEDADEDGIEPLVFDAVTNTYNLSAKFHTDDKLEEIATNFIESGLYQKTLILLLGAKSEGLKLSVWAKSIKTNFKNESELAQNNGTSSGYSSCQEDENIDKTSLTKSNSNVSIASESGASDELDLKLFEDHCMSKPLFMFFALHRLQLIRLRSAKDCRNDIRIHLPASKLIHKLKYLN